MDVMIVLFVTWGIALISDLTGMKPEMVGLLAWLGILGVCLGGGLLVLLYVELRAWLRRRRRARGVS